MIGSYNTLLVARKRSFHPILTSRYTFTFTSTSLSLRAPKEDTGQQDERATRSKARCPLSFTGSPLTFRNDLKLFLNGNHILKECLRQLLHAQANGAYFCQERGILLLDLLNPSAIRARLAADHGIPGRLPKHIGANQPFNDDCQPGGKVIPDIPMPGKHRQNGNSVKDEDKPGCAHTYLHLTGIVFQLRQLIPGYRVLVRLLHRYLLLTFPIIHTSDAHSNSAARSEEHTSELQSRFD